MRRIILVLAVAAVMAVVAVAPAQAQIVPIPEPACGGGTQGKAQQAKVPIYVYTPLYPSGVCAPPGRDTEA